MTRKDTDIGPRPSHRLSSPFVDVVTTQLSLGKVAPRPDNLEILRDNHNADVFQNSRAKEASIPMMVDQLRRNQMINSGELVMLLGTSAGYSQAGLLFQM